MNELLIIFTKNDSDTQDAYFDLLLGNNTLERDWKFVIFNNETVSINNYNFRPDVILINDEILSKDKKKSFEIWQSICSDGFPKLIQDSEKIFIIYHGNPDNHSLSNNTCGEKIKDHLVSIINNYDQKDKYFHQFDHHNFDGRIIKKIQNLVEARCKNQEDYYSAFKEIILK